MAAVALLLASCFSSAEPASVSVYGPYVGPEADLFGEVLADFEAETGIKVNYVGSGSFQNDFEERVSSADLPDMVILPQPALLSQLVADGFVNAVDEDQAQLIRDTIGDVWATIVELDGGIFGIPYRFVVKSIVWYRADVFAEMGYETPESLDELWELTDEIIADGRTPWCAGMDDGLATGWWATDWVEDIVLRRSGLETYSSWAAGVTPFTDPAIVDAMDEFQVLVAEQGALVGGRRGLLNTSIDAAMDPMFDSSPGCLMHKQASFQPVWFPEDFEFDGETVDFFALPDIEPGPSPLVVSGEIAVLTSDNVDATQLLIHLLSDEAFEPWRGVGGSLVARAEEDPDLATNLLDEKLFDMVDATDVIVFDASDVMTQEVGTGAFFEGMVDLVVGSPPEVVADFIQATADSVFEG